MPDATTTPTFNGTAVVSTLDGVTTVLVAFLFVCLVFPSIVRNRHQYYAALAMIIGIIALHSLTLILDKSSSFMLMAGVFTGILQIGALLLLVLSVGGLTVRQLAGDMSRAYEVMRRGETTKEVIIPIGGQVRPTRPTPSRPVPLEPEELDPKVYHIDSESPTGETSNEVDEDDDDKGIPLNRK